MALADIVMTEMLQTSKEPGLYTLYKQQEAEKEKADLDKQVTLSNLETARLGRDATSMEMDQSAYNFDMKKQRIKQIGDLVSKAMAEPDKERQHEALKSIQGALVKYGADPQEIYAFQNMLKSYSPQEEYGYQQQMADQGLEQGAANIGLTKSQAANYDAEAAYTRAGRPGSRGNTYKNPPLIGTKDYEDMSRPFIDSLGIENGDEKKGLSAAMYQGLKTLSSSAYQFSPEEAEQMVRVAVQEAIGEDPEDSNYMGMGGLVGREKNKKFDLNKYYQSLNNNATALIQISDLVGKDRGTVSAYAQSLGMTPAELAQQLQAELGAE